MNAKNSAFSLLEILLVVVVIGIVATMAIPQLIRKDPSANWENVLDEINNLVYYARQEAIASQTVHRLHFTLDKKGSYIVTVETEKENFENPNKKLYEPTRSVYFNPIYTLPSSIELKAIYHGKEEELRTQKQHAYCYVIPNGLVQETIIHALKKEKNKESSMSFKMLPFLGKFELVQGFVKP